MNSILIFLVGTWTGSFLGVGVMCLLQINRENRTEREENERSSDTC